MAKKKNGVNLILSIVGLATAVLSFIALALNFVTQKVTTVSVFGKKDTVTGLNLEDWKDTIEFFQKYNDGVNNNAFDLAGWNMGHVFMIITLALVAILAVALVLKLFIKNKAFNMLTLVLGIACVVSALIFAIAMFVGCGAVSNTKLLGNPSFTASAAVYVLAISAAVTGAMSIVVSSKK